GERGGGVAERRLGGVGAGRIGGPGQLTVVSDERTRDFLAPLPLSLLPLEEERYAELEELGVKRIGQLAELPGAAVAERLGPGGRYARTLARGEGRGRGRARRPPAEIDERIEWPDGGGHVPALPAVVHSRLTQWRRDH